MGDEAEGFFAIKDGNTEIIYAMKRTGAIGPNRIFQGTQLVVLPKPLVTERIGMTVGTTGYGWTASNYPSEFGGLVTIMDAPGVSAPLRMRAHLNIGEKDYIFADFFRYLVYSLQNRVEKAELGNVNDEWSYYFKLNTNSPTSGNYSQHAGGLAFD